VVARWAAPPPGPPESGPGARDPRPPEILGYRLRFGPKNSSVGAAVLDLPPRDTSYTAKGGLAAGSTYVFALSARSRAGPGDEARREIRIPESPPSGYPEIREPVGATCRSLRLSWRPPAPEDRHGTITAYTLAYREAPEPGGPSGVALALPVPVAGSTTAAAAVPGPRAEAEAGPGPTVTTAATAADDTGPVSAAGSVVSAAAPPPPSPAPHRYRYRVVSIPASQSEYTVLGLNHSSAYELRLRAHTEAGPGPLSPPRVWRTLALETGRAVGPLDRGR